MSQHTLFLMQKIQNYQQLPQITNNIFEQPNSKYGPKYDKNNKIIARSIVGKPDILERIKKKLEESKLCNSPNMKNSLMFSKMKQSSRNLMKKSQSTNKMNESSNLSREISHNKSSLVQLINKDQNLEQYLQETRLRIKTNELQQTENEKQLTLFQKHQQTRQQRVITSFQEREQSWEILNTTLQSKCQTRSKDKLTLLQKSQAYRLKQQLIQEIPQPPKNWYQQLRSNTELQHREQININLDSKTLLMKQNELESSLKVNGESKLKREFGQGALITIMDC